MIGKIYKIFLILFVCCSCSPSLIQIKEQQDIKFDKTPDYNIHDELEIIPKPDIIEPVYVKFENNQLMILSEEEKEKATHILLAPKEYAKIGGLLKLTKAYKSIVLDQEVLVNTYIAQINAFKEYLELERQKTLAYQELYINSENSYRLEKNEHRIDNFINKTGIYIVTIGSISLLLFAL